MDIKKFPTDNIYQSNLSHQHITFDKMVASRWIENLYNWLFSLQKEYENYEFFKEKELSLYNTLITLVQFEVQNKDESHVKVNTFFEHIDQIHSDLILDLKANLAFDPAAKSECEIILAYPGFFSIMVYRVAHMLHNMKLEILPRFLSEYAHGKTGIDIHPGAQIGKEFFIDHGTGIVIGETTLIGNNVKIYQGVTLGALSVSKDLATEKRHPTIEDHVTIYANATILGGNTVIGQGATIGGNVWITQSIPADSMVFHKSDIVVKNKKGFPEAIDFSI